MKRIVALCTFRLYLIILFVKELPISSLEEIYLVRFLQLIGSLLFFITVASSEWKTFIAPYIKRKTKHILFLAMFGAFLAGLSQSKLSNVLVIFNLLGFIGFGLYFAFLKNNNDMTWFLGVLTLYTMFEIFSGIHIKQWFRGSYNHVSILMLFGVIGFYSEHINNKGRSLSLFPILSVVYICIISTGRSAILSSFLLLLIVLIYNAFRSVKGLLLSSFFLIVVIIYSSDFIFFMSEYLYKFKNQGFSEVGREIVYSYVSRNVSVPNVILGINYELLFYKYDLSIHNSFLSIHSRFGLLGVVGIILLPVLSLLSINGGSFIWLSFLIVLFVRSFTDTVLIADGFLFGSLFFSIFFSGLRGKSRCL